MNILTTLIGTKVYMLYSFTCLGFVYIFKIVLHRLGLYDFYVL